MNLKAALDVLVASAEMDAKSLMSKTGEQTPASDALWTIAAKLRKLSAQAASAPDLPPPFDSQEEAQRAAGIWPQEAEPATVRVKPSALDEMAAQAASWVSKAASERVMGASPALGAPYTVGVDPAHGPDAMAYMLRGMKPSNPKEAVGDTKVPLALCSPIAKAHWALAQHCGRVKYGAWNWREAGARISVYLSAIQRHADGYLSGERVDPADGTHHLGNIMACCAILLEAEAAGKLTDDRPPEVGMRCAYAEVEQQQAELTKKYSDRNPKHWTR